MGKDIPPLNAQYQSDWMNPFPNAKGEFLFHFLRIDVGSKYSVPNGKQRPQVVHVVVRVIAMVDLMVSGCHKDPLQPLRSPRDIHMLPIIAEHMFDHDHLKYPPRGSFQQRECRNEGEVK